MTSKTPTPSLSGFLAAASIVEVLGAAEDAGKTLSASEAVALKDACAVTGAATVALVGLVEAFKVLSKS